MSICAENRARNTVTVHSYRPKLSTNQYTTLFRNLPASRCAEAFSTKAMAQAASYAKEDSCRALIPVRFLNLIAYSWAV